ncbi:MAG: type 4a pilus biogenesis protein PilO [Deltaproteobacteria bacterium]|nr:type 4a pilus biogenesis protein PilO [Deltaproteobacteria bacterium]
METGSFTEKVEKIRMPYRIAILAGTVILLVGLFIWFIYLPKSEQIDKARQEIKTLEIKLNQAKMKAKDLKKFEQEFAEVNIQFADALNLLPNNKEIPALLKTLTQLGTDSQLEFLLFSPQRERPKDFYMEIPVAVQVSGSYHNVAVFFDKVGRMDRIVNILNVDMKPVKDRSTSLTTKCDAVTYRFKGETDAPQQTKK